MRLSFVIVTVVISAFVGLLLLVEEDGQSQDAGGWESQGAPVPMGDSAADTMSLMQGIPRVDRIGVKDVNVSRPAAVSGPRPIVKDRRGLLHQGLSQEALRTGVLRARTALLAITASYRGNLGAFPILVMLLLVLFTCIVIVLIMGSKGSGTSRAAPGAGGSRPEVGAVVSEGPPRQPFIPSTPSQGQPFARVPAFAAGDAPAPATGHAGIWHSISRPTSVMTGLSIPGLFRAAGPTPTQDSLVANSFNSPDRRTLMQPDLRGIEGPMGVPPPLCPTLVLPVCEARFGVNMNDLAALTQEGEIDIVGLSGNPLLRAAVKKVHGNRRLEISMPEAGSAPRATVGPAAQGSRSLELRALKGAFYGMLEMRNTGACYVVKDGGVVLTIDGDTDSLQLSIKSGQGISLASVRCSQEFLGEVDHVEVRVEPGVDTVLVLSCVLAVLLLSPYPPTD